MAEKNDNYSAEETVTGKVFENCGAEMQMHAVQQIKRHSLYQKCHDHNCMCDY